MNFDIENRTILKVIHGSRAYGTNVETSDTDFKGICIEPKNYYFGFIDSFEQQVLSKPNDTVIFSLKKFVSLAAKCNPNAIEILFVDPSSFIKIDEFGEELLSIRHLFLSKQAATTFMGYARGQLSRIQTHRSWLLNPPSSKPVRTQFGLSEVDRVSKSEFGAFEASCKQGLELEISKEVLSVFIKEKQWRAALQQWEQYNNWLKQRNPARAILEAKCGYDSKHAMHLIRLLKMCEEILKDGIVQVKRKNDIEQLLEIRNGNWSFDQIIEYSEMLKEKCKLAEKNSLLPNCSNEKEINNVVISMIERYISKFG